MVTGFKSLDKSFGAKIWDSFFTSIFGFFWIWHHMIVTELDRCIHLFLIPMPFALFDAWRILSYSLPWFLLWMSRFDLGYSIHRVLLFEWWFASTHGWRRTSWTINHFTDLCLQYIFWYILSVMEFWIFIITLLAFILWHGIILNTIHLFILLPFRGSFVESFLGKILMWKWMEPQNSILDFIYLSYLTGFKKLLQCVLKVTSLQQSIKLKNLVLIKKFTQINSNEQFLD